MAANRGGDGTFRVSRYTHKPEGGEHSLPTPCKLGSPWQVPFVLSHGVPRKLAALLARAFTEPRRRGDDSRVALGVEGEVGPPAPAYRLSGIIHGPLASPHGGWWSASSA